MVASAVNMGEMMFTITIEKTQEVVRTLGNEWRVVAQVNGESQFGYTPEIKRTVDETVQIYTQTVETLDLAAVVALINGIGNGVPVQAAAPVAPSGLDYYQACMDEIARLEGAGIERAFIDETLKCGVGLNVHGLQFSTPDEQRRALQILIDTKK